MTKTKLMVLACFFVAFGVGVVACFFVAFGAGVAVGVAFTRLTAGPQHGSWLEHELSLTPAQREQMHKIWSQVISLSAPQEHEQRQALQKERDEAIRGLLSNGQKAKYEEVMQKYTQKLAALEDGRKKAFEEAVERTKQILTDSQRTKYLQLLQERSGRHPSHGPRDRPSKP